MAEIKLSIFSWLSGKISASMSHFLRLKVLFLENYFCDFSNRFSPLGLAEFVEKNMGSCLKTCGMNLFLLHKLKSGLSLAAPYC